MRIDCPFCGFRDHSEFQYGGDASHRMPHLSDTDEEVWYNYTYVRQNPRGELVEFWQHVLGCRHWLKVERNSVTHDISSVRLARE